jgi:hypothetical protein
MQRPINTTADRMTIRRKLGWFGGSCSISMECRMRGLEGMLEMGWGWLPFYLDLEADET